LIDPKNKPKWIASGFLYGYHTPTKKEPNLYRIFLVTNRHVFEDLQKMRTCVLRFNPQKVDEPAHYYSIELLDKKGQPLWLSHRNKKIDVAIIPINYQRLKKEAMQANYFRSNSHVADVQKLNDLGIIEGDFAYVLGFPMELVGRKRNTVIARGGIIARIRDTLTKSNNEYLIDAFVFPGNSGGPVVSKPEAFAIRGTKSQNASYLIGIVKGYLAYEDVAISLQTKRARIRFEENSGLAAVHPIDFVNKIIKSYLRKHKKSLQR